ncbi:MAG: HDIG domain-containing protein, partial [Clostridia bacterium]|nr:HDIG domain-containing protein [Clostridia bacterium]
VRVATRVVVSFLLAIMVRASSINEFNTIKDFFTGKVWLQILIISVILAAMLSTIYFYSIYIRRDLRKDKKLVQVLTSSIVLTFVLALVFGSLINLYVAPLVLSSLLVGALLDKRIGIVTNVLISQAFFLTAMIVFGADRIIESSAALITSMITSIFLISNLDKMRTRFRFTVLGLLVGLCTAVIPMLINLLVNPDDILTVLMSGVWSFLSVVLSIALQMIFLPIMEYIFRINTVFRLGELCSLENPLLKKLAVNAPGTFNHSVAVGNLAEICADAIGENPQLAKVCAYYHDVGKMKNSEYFIENQSGLPEDNPHNDLIPEVSVSMIVSHVQASYDMIKAERLPDIIADVAREHHGTTPVNYFLYKAQSYTEDDLNKLEFSYPGPKPQTKIAAIIMIVDTVEAASRAIANLSSHDQFRKFIHNLIKSKSDVGQFEECGITFKDLKTIEDTLVETLPSMYHSRIQYTKPSEK